MTFEEMIRLFSRHEKIQKHGAENVSHQQDSGQSLFTQIQVKLVKSVASAVNKCPSCSLWNKSTVTFIIKTLLLLLLSPLLQIEL